MQLQLKIQIQDISKPPVWRRILVPGDFSLHRLHQVIQIAFGWEDCHLYQFSEQEWRSDIYYGIPPDPSDPYGDNDIQDSSKITCAEIFIRERQTYTYTYDFGDNWTHKITVEKILDTPTIHAELLAGKGACPPEDCSGPSGYKHLLEVISNPSDADYKAMREWLGMKKGDEWDVHYFDIEQIKN